MLTPFTTAIYTASIVLMGFGLFALVKGEFPLPDRWVAQRLPDRARLAGLVLIAAFPLVWLAQPLGDAIGSRAGEKEYVQARMALQAQRDLSNQAFGKFQKQGDLVFFEQNPERDAQRAGVEQQIAQLDREHEAQKARSKEFAARGLELMMPVVCLVVAVAIVVTGAGTSGASAPDPSVEALPLELQLELSRIELEWERERPKHLVASRFGKLAVPRKHDTAIVIAVVAVAGIAGGISAAAKMPGDAGIAAGIAVAGVLLLIGLGAGAWSYAKAEAYEQAEAEYLRKRAAARSKYDGPSETQAQ